MAQLNVFEITQNALSKSRVDESKTTKTAKKGLKESRKTTKKAKPFGKIPANKIKLESLSFIKEAEEDDEVIDYTPDEDVVLVIDPEMDETPETVEDAEEAAEELVGDYVCKCSICGANYVCDCEDVDVNEDLEIEEGECPVCGETGEQIVVGEIAPAEVADDEAEDGAEDAVDVDVDADDVDDADDESSVDIDINVDDVDDFDVDADADDEYEESISRAKRRTALRRESKAINRKPMRKSVRAKNESRVLARKPARKPMPKRAAMESKATEYNFDDATMSRMLTSFAKENYDNVRFVKITKANCRRNRLTLEGVVVTKKGSKRATKFVAENFAPKSTMRVNFTETGAFTESAVTKGSQFTVNFVTKGKTITPTALNYNYVVKENRNAWEVKGRVMNESVKRNRSRRTK